MMKAVTQYEKTASPTILDKIERVAQQRLRLLRLERLVNVLLIGSEYVMYCITFLMLYQWRAAPHFPLWEPRMWPNLSGQFGDYIFLFAVIIVIFSIQMTYRGLYRLHSQSSFVDDFFKIVKSVFIAFMIAIGLLFLLKTSIIYSRLVIVIFSISMVVIASLMRCVKMAVMMSFKKSGRLTRNVLIIGGGRIGTVIHKFLSERKASGYRVIGFLDDYQKGSMILGKIDQLETIIQRNHVDDIYITIPSERDTINQLLSKIRKYDVDIKIIPEMYNFVTSSIQFHRTDAYPYMEVVRTPLKGMNLFLKRVVDIVLSFLGIIISLPVFAVTALLIKLDSRGPIIFKQKRIGKNGVPFNIYKFRSMVVDAEKLQSRLMDQNEADGPVFKIKNDPRVTRVGRWIRKYSIDELPQLFNVLKGDMSLIGPRPPLPHEVEKYTDYHWRRLDVKPGISGLWQVSGRSDLSFEEWVNLDIYYIENWSIALDIKILLRTIPTVLFSKGAY
jgi:exopolysaccharide biosynthesis polyprenyl glycosylphosphotransferase